MTAGVEMLDADVVIFGGGVAGLWLLGDLLRAGYSARLLESRQLGFGQTRYAQGIIHGGTKYALAGKLTASSEAIAAMPGLWRDCLAGERQPDLSSVKIRSPYQYMWSTASLSSRLAGFFGSRMMRSRTRSLERERRPVLFQHADFRGQIYQLEEPVLDTESLVHCLAEPLAGCIDLYRADSLQFENDAVVSMTLHNGTPRQIRAKRLILTAGQGNRDLLQRLGHEAPEMQLRPLKMVMLRGNLPDDIFAHCLGASVNPRITITSHHDQNRRVVWYLGGQLAEEGVRRTDAQQIAEARRELAEILPWYDFSGVQWAVLDINRAEPRQPDGKRPDDVFVHQQGNIITAWPTKLAFAPRLSEKVQVLLESSGLAHGGEQQQIAEGPLEFAPLPWQEENRWK